MLETDAGIRELTAGQDLPGEAFDREAAKLLTTAPIDFGSKLAQANAARKKRDTALQRAASELAVGFVLLGFIAVCLIYWLVKVKLARVTEQWPVWPLAPAGVLLVAWAYIADYIRKRPKRSDTVIAAEAESAQARLRDQIRSLVVIPAIYNAVPVVFAAPAADLVSLTGTPGLPFHIKAGRRIETRSFQRAFHSLSWPGGAAIALAGSRGVGKSELLKEFCESPARAASLDDGGVIGVIVPAPVAYDAESFLRLLIRRLAEEVPGYNRYRYLGGRVTQVRRTHDAAAVILILACLAAGLMLRFGVPDVSRHIVGWLLVAAATLIAAIWFPRRLAMKLRTGTPNVQIFLYRFRPLRKRRPSAEEVGTQITRKRRHELAMAAVRMVQRIRYVETRSLSMESSASVHGVGLTRTSGQSLEQVPLSEAELATELEDLVNELRGGSYEVRIGIDELDKLADGEEAEKFLSGIKVLFAIPDCSFVLTISENAAAQFAQRGMPVRDVFDSSLDSVVMVDPLAFRESRQLLRARLREDRPEQTADAPQASDDPEASGSGQLSTSPEVPGRKETSASQVISDGQVLVCHCLSGGLPRDLLRFCRQMGDVNSQLGGNRPLTAVLEALVSADIRARIDGMRAALRSKTDIAGASSFFAELERLSDAIGTTEVFGLLIDLLKADGEFVGLSGPADVPERDPASSADTEDSSIRNARRQICAYTYFAEAARCMFGPEGPLARDAAAEVDHLLIPYEMLAEGRRQLELDAAGGWRRVTQAMAEAGCSPACGTIRDRDG